MCVSRVTCSESLVRFKEKVFKKNYLGGLSATFLYKASLVWCLKPYYVAVPIKKVRKRLLLWAKKRCSEAKCLWQKKTLHRWRSIIVMQLESKLLIYQQKIIWSSEYLLKSGKTVVKKRTPAFPPKKKWVPVGEHVFLSTPLVINPFRGPNDLCICLSLPAHDVPETSRELGSLNCSLQIHVFTWWDYAK